MSAIQREWGNAVGSKGGGNKAMRRREERTAGKEGRKEGRKGKVVFNKAAQQFKKRTGQ